MLVFLMNSLFWGIVYLGDVWNTFTCCGDDNVLYILAHTNWACLTVQFVGNSLKSGRNLRLSFSREITCGVKFNQPSINIQTHETQTLIPKVDPEWYTIAFATLRHRESRGDIWCYFGHNCV